MLAAEPDLTDLRQGDICEGWVIPSWNLNTFQVNYSFQGASSRPSAATTGVHLKGKSSPLVICSHDCEVENFRNRYGLLVAPLLTWPFPTMAGDKSLSLISSRKPALVPVREAEADAEDSISPAEIDESLEGPAPRAEGLEVATALRYDWINWFPINRRVDDEDLWHIVDFSMITPVAPPVVAKKALLESKSGEMTDTTRTEFKEKLAAFFGR